MTEKYMHAGADIQDYEDNWLDDLSVVHHSQGTRIFPDVDTNVDIKSEYNRSDYDYYRPSSRIPETPIEIIKMCTKAYKKIGIVRNVIDLMSEFACKGIRLQHPIPGVQRFYEKWFQKISGKERSERFLNLLYREGNVIVKRTDGRLKPAVQKEWKRIRADLLFGEIPSKYDFLSPTVLEVVGGGLANFLGKLIYRLKLPPKLAQEIKAVEKLDPSLLDQIPTDFLSLLKKGRTTIDLDQSKIHAYFYKKDDWQVWADPMIYSILDDLMTVEKMKLADISALDGAISNIRLWRVGILNPDNPKANIIPTKAGLNKIRNMLQNNVAGGTMDLVMGPEVDFKESNTQVHQFLGSQKYEVHLCNIYDGMGIPPTLRSGAKGGNTGSFIALKTLVERLQYGRDILTRFWQEQVELVQKSMGFSMPATVVFDKIILSDESVILKILLELADRDLISIDSLLEKFDMVPMVEKARIRKETKQRGNKLPNKASPYHNPQWDLDVKKQLLLNGNIKPKDMGLDVENYKPMINNGRPPNVVETKKRKPKPKGGIRTTAELESMIAWATSAYKSISDLLNKGILESYAVSNMRKLTNTQAKEAEYLKFSVLLGFNPFEDISKDRVYNIIENQDLAKDINSDIQQSVARFIELNQREPTLDELRSIYVSIYVMEKLEDAKN